jgi:hypothetical protein
MVNRIYERFMDAADVEMPPSSLSADDVYAAAWQRRRRRIEVSTAVAVIVGLVVAVVGIDGGWSGGDRVAGGPTPSPTAGARDPIEPHRDWPKGTRDGQVVWAAADADRLYSVVTRCVGAADCTTQLLGSDDAGTTWTVRQADFGKGYDWHVTAPVAGMLYRTVSRLDPNSTDPATHMVDEPKVSRDGGRNWTDIRVTDAEIAAVPAGGWLECHGQGQDACRTLLVVDPGTARKGRLANVPDLELNAVVNVPASAGFWVLGYDREKGTPAVAISGDRGRTWIVHRFTDAPRETGVLAASVDGVTGYAVLGQYHPGATSRANPTPAPATSTHQVYRTGDAGRTWQRVDRDGPLPDNVINSGSDYVATDGTHFVMTEDKAPQRWYRSGGDGRTYRTGGPTGLGDRLIPATGLQIGVVTLAPGTYVAFDDDAVYRSTDGLAFSRTPVHAPR